LFPLAAFVFLTIAMAIVAALIITAGRIAVRGGQVTRARKARLFPG
jgi:hypothetical protein